MTIIKEYDINENINDIQNHKILFLILSDASNIKNHNNLNIIVSEYIFTILQDIRINVLSNVLTSKVLKYNHIVYTTTVRQSLKTYLRYLKIKEISND